MRKTLGAAIIALLGGCAGTELYEKPADITRNTAEIGHEQVRPEWMNARNYEGPIFFIVSDEGIKAINEGKYVMYDSIIRRLEVWPSARAQDATIYELDEKGMIIMVRYRIDGVEVRGVDRFLRLREQEEVEGILRNIADSNGF
ncbi:hypothetical protein HY483_02330 [Candidatus Woesearchaeota archaeon]|nr:hypothetical protein [Candidatus Woesearchaeota archaeon]